MRCPDCDHDGFIADMDARYGKPVTVNGMRLYADPDVPSHYLVNAGAFARAFCPIHALRPATAQPAVIEPPNSGPGRGSLDQ